MDELSIATLLISIFGGLITSLLISMEVRLFKPKVEVSQKNAEKDNQFKFKIQNNSNRDIGDIYMRVTYRTTKKGHHSYSEKSIPVLHGKKESVKNYHNEITVRFDNAKLTKPSNGASQTKQNTEPLEETILDFFKNNPDGCVELEISYYDYNLIYGAVRRFKYQKYETTKCIMFNSIFTDGSLEPSSIPNNYITYLKS